MELPKRYLHDRVVLLLLAALGALVVIGVSLVLLKFDAAKNPATIAEYRQNLSGSGYLSGKPADIYLLALFMLVSGPISLLLSAKAYHLHRYISVLILAAAVLVLLLGIIVSNALISLQ